MFQVFHLDVAKVDLGCCICCIDNVRMLQAYASRVSDVCCKCFHLDISKVDVGVAHIAMAIHTCFKCFVCFQTYVENVLSECFLR
jgi:hypothetical protein